MSPTLEDLDFMAFANKLAMQEFAASFDDDRGLALQTMLVQEFKAAGSPRTKRKWLRPRLAELFTWFESPPEWIEQPMWPIPNGKPMTFIRQFPVEINDVAATRLAPDTVLYVFGSRVEVQHGWEMHYRVVEQHHSLRGLVAVVRSPHS